MVFGVSSFEASLPSPFFPKGFPFPLKGFPFPLSGVGNGLPFPLSGVGNGFPFPLSGVGKGLPFPLRSGVRLLPSLDPLVSDPLDAFPFSPLSKAPGEPF